MWCRACCSGSALCVGHAELTSPDTHELSKPYPCLTALPASSALATACVLDVSGC